MRYRIRPCSLVSVLPVVIPIVFAGASGCTVLAPDDETLTVVFYNVENLFDETLDGTEYDDFTPEAGWDGEDVADRLERLGNALESIDPTPDIITLSEVENDTIFDRIFDDYYVDVPFHYRVFSSNAGGATGVAIASRYPIVGVRTLQARAGETPPLRPVIEARIALAETELVVFVNHWKSKRGGGASTEALRRASARLVGTRLAELHAEEPRTPVLLCGDFNEGPRELDLVDGVYQTAFIPAEDLLEWRHDAEGAPEWYSGDPGIAESILIASTAEEATELSGGLGRPVMIDGWHRRPGDGSYWYFDHWEQIDQILMNPAAAAGEHLSRIDFSPVRTPAISDENGRPVSWFDDRSGVSDHLPVMLELSMPFD
ncbi:MAG: endonuclease/exonuclease/phosphatase family protein [Alkalispirochaeta sp.]